jgi:hypothetical protein
MSAAALISVLKKRRNEQQAAREAAAADAPETQEVGLMTLTEEARALVKALQEDDISEAELLKMVNTQPSGEDTRADVIIRRARKIFRYLDINNDGVIGLDDLEEVKGRLYQVRAHARTHAVCASHCCATRRHSATQRQLLRTHARLHPCVRFFPLLLASSDHVSLRKLLSTRRWLTHKKTPFRK